MAKILGSSLKNSDLVEAYRIVRFLSENPPVSWVKAVKLERA